MRGQEDLEATWLMWRVDLELEPDLCPLTSPASNPLPGIQPDAEEATRLSCSPGKGLLTLANQLSGENPALIPSQLRPT